MARWRVRWKPEITQHAFGQVDKLAWLVYSKITGTAWFEVFVMLNILLIGVATGVDLETGGGAGLPSVRAFVSTAAGLTTVVFAAESALKIVAEGRHPYRYFTDPENGEGLLAYTCRSLAAPRLTVSVALRAYRGFQLL